MRNWHNSYVCNYINLPLLYICRTLPMRNWHCCVIKLIDRWSINSFCRTLPMRNWHIHSKWNAYSHALIHVGHYLWGIDTLKSYSINPLFILSDITYEELTLIVLICIFIKKCRTLPMRNWHGNKIYFFWKLPISSRTLPMRNWHLIVGIYPADIPFLVGHYLWGIDT